ncbi:hypothetical protein ACEPAG_3614 [Sanghuangporus baumii]
MHPDVKRKALGPMLYLSLSSCSSSTSPHPSKLFVLIYSKWQGGSSTQSLDGTIEHIDFSARIVVIGDLDLELDEVGMLKSILMTLAY